MSLKDILYLEPWRPLGWVEWNIFCNCGRRHYGEHFCDTILNSDQEMSFKILSRALVALSPGGAEPFIQFSRGQDGKHSCEIILNLDEWLRRICRLKKKYTHNGRTMHDGQKFTTKAHLESSAQVS